MGKVVGLSDRGVPCGEDSPRAVHSDRAVREALELVDSGVPVCVAAERSGIPRRTLRCYVDGTRRSILPAAWAVRRGRRWVRIG